MRRKFIPNPYFIDGDVARIALQSRNRETVAFATIDLVDLERVLAEGRWIPGWNEQAQSFYPNTQGNRLTLHRFIANAPKGVEVDHKDRDTLNCHGSNLRHCTHAENMRNRKFPAHKSLTGVRNVTWEEKRGLYRVRLKVNGHGITIGRFADIESARIAAEEARARLHGEFAA